MKNAALFAVLSAAVALTACANTLDGAGKDAKSAGKAVEKTADDVRKKL